MRRERYIIYVWVLIIGSVLLPTISVDIAMADGGVYIVDYEEHVSIPSQKAAIFWDGANETMILSTKISSDTFSNMAWVVPIPSNTSPEVEEGEIQIFSDIAESFPEYGGKGYSGLEICLVIVIVIIVGIVLLGVAFALHKMKLSIFLILLFALIIVGFIFAASVYVYVSGMIGAGPSGYSDVEVVEIKKVAIYDIAVLKATNATELVSWLNENEFVVPLSSVPILQNYCNKSDFYFVVNKINLTNQYTTDVEIAVATNELKEGIATPLKITFQPEQPFYPLQMTSINDGNTKINVYFISNYYVEDASGYLTNEGLSQFWYTESTASFQAGFDITWMTYDGATKDLIGDSYFIEIE